MFKWWKTGRNAREIILREAVYDYNKTAMRTCVDQDHELQVHDLIKRRAGAIQISGAPALYIHDNAYEVLILFISL